MKDEHNVVVPYFLMSSKYILFYFEQCSLVFQGKYYYIAVGVRI